VARLDKPEADNDGDGVRVLLRFLEISPLSKAGVLVLLAIDALAEVPRSGEEAELGCLSAISVADKLLVLLLRLRDLFSLFEIRTLASSAPDFDLIKFPEEEAVFEL